MSETTGFQFDPFDFAVHADPYPFYARLRLDYPAYFSEGAGCWVLSRHADIVAAMRQPTVFSSTAGNVINDSPEKVGRTVGSVDPPRHTRLRDLVNDAFNRKQVAGEGDRIRAETIRLMQQALDRGEFDLVRDVTAPLSGAVMSTLLGMDGVDHAHFKRLVDISLYRDPVTRDRTKEGTQAQADLFTMVADAVARKRVAPAQDLISSLIAARIDGEALAPDEVVWMARAVLGAGFESTSSFLANGTLALLTHPGERRRLTDDPGLMDGSIDEMLRYESPAQRFSRILTQDQVLHGQTMSAGTKVMMLYGSGNRDEAVFDQADRFDIGRKPGRHLGFGNGIHFCAGAALARLVGRIYFTELAAILPGLRLAQAGPHEWAHSPTFRSLVSLPVAVGRS
jgi:cytochrome P450